MRSKTIFALALPMTALFYWSSVSVYPGSLDPTTRTGKKLFFDTNLSTRPDKPAQPATGRSSYTGRTRHQCCGAVYEGAVPADSATASRPRPPMLRQPDPALGWDEMGGWHVLGWPGHGCDPRRPAAEQAWVPS